MKQPVCAVFDKKTGLYSNPFTLRHIGDAIREFDIIRKDTNTKIGKNPEDFELFQLANFDEELGQFEELKPALHLSSGM